MEEYMPPTMTMAESICNHVKDERKEKRKQQQQLILKPMS